MLFPEAREGVRGCLSKYIEARKLGLSIEEEDVKGVTTTGVAYTLLREREGERWFCFAVVLHDDHKVGVWTTGYIQVGEGPLAPWTDYTFNDSTFDAWLDQQLDRMDILEELTLP